MGFAAVSAIVITALIAGFAVQVLVKSPIAYEWLVVALAAAFGAMFFSETVVPSPLFSIKDWGPQLDGLHLGPAIIGGALFALVADIGTRNGRLLTNA